MYKKMRDTVTNATAKVKDGVAESYDAARGAISVASGKVCDIATETYGSTRESLSDVADKASGVATDTANKVGSRMSKATEAGAGVVSEGVTSARGAVSSGFAVSRDYVNGFGSSMGAFWATRQAREANKVLEAERRGEGREKVRSIEREKRFEAALKKAGKRLQDNDDYFKIIIAMQAVAQASAASNGTICSEDQEQIDELILGMGARWLPQLVRDTLDAMIAEPPSIQEAFVIANRVGPGAQDLFEEIVRFVISLDGVVSESEQQFVSRWVQLRATA